MTVNTSIGSRIPLGANYYFTYGSSGSATDTGVPFKVGEHSYGDNGTTWRFVKAAAAIKQFDAVTIDENHAATSMTNANARKGYRVGFAQVAIASGDYGWVAMSGTGIQCRVKAVLNHTGAIYCPATSSGSAGVLRASAATRIKIQGLVTVTTSSGSAKSPEIQATWPVLVI